MTFNVYDFSVGSGRLDQVFNDDQIHFFNIDGKFNTVDTQAFMELTPEYLVENFDRPDFIWSSPPCVTFSVASLSHHWTGGKRGYVPRTQAAVDNQKIVSHARYLIERTKPRFGYIIENPRGILRKLPLLADLPRTTVTYCRYGHRSMKPTDLWGEVPGWTPRAMCQNGNPDHEASPRGSRSGINGFQGNRAEVPVELIQDLRRAMTSQLERISA